MAYAHHLTTVLNIGDWESRKYEIKMAVGLIFPQPRFLYLRRLDYGTKISPNGLPPE